MRKRSFMTTVHILTVSILLASVAALAGGQRQDFPQAQGDKDVMITEIPGVIAAGSKWKIAWQGTDNADGLVGTPDGGLLFGQEQPSVIGKLDRDDHYSIYIKDTHGAG